MRAISSRTNIRRTTNNGVITNSFLWGRYLTADIWRSANTMDDTHDCPHPQVSNHSREPSERKREIWIVSFRERREGNRVRCRKKKGNSRHIQLPRFRSVASICWTDKAECHTNRDNMIFEADGEGKTFGA